MTYANGVHSRVGDYAAQCMRDADACFTGANGMKKDVPDKSLYYGWTEVDHKLVAVCLGPSQAECLMISWEGMTPSPE